MEPNKVWLNPKTISSLYSKLKGVLMFEKSINANSLFNSQEYLKITNKIKNHFINDYIEQSPIMKILLSYAANNYTLTENHINYLTEELDLLIKYAPNFPNSYYIAHIVCDFYRKKNLFVNIGRASSTSSILAYISGITQIDPTKYNLSYHRFVQKDMDQITFDIDVPDRNIIINFLKEEFKNKLAHKSSINYCKTKTALKRILPKDDFLGKHDHANLNFYLKEIDKEIKNPGYSLKSRNKLLLQSLVDQNILSNKDLELQMLLAQMKLNQSYENNKLLDKELFSLIIENNLHFIALFTKYPSAKKELLDLIGSQDGFFLHMHNLVIMQDPNQFEFIDEKYQGLPAIHPDSLNRGTQTSINILELSVLADINNYIKNKKDLTILENKDGTESEWKSFEQKIRDPEVTEEYFQAYGILKGTVTLRPLFSIEDFYILTSYSRPGALSKYNIKDININCPEKFKALLSYTNGWLLFQEDVIEIANIAKIDNPGLFLKNMAKHQNMEQYAKHFSKEEFDFLKEFSILTFNKSHAISYAQYSLLHYRTKL